MINLGKRDIRVACESPRTDENFMRIDAAINEALTESEAK
jgi:hypothetical protein